MVIGERRKRPGREALKPSAGRPSRLVERQGLSLKHAGAHGFPIARVRGRRHHYRPTMAMTSQSRLGSGELHGSVHHVFVDFENVQEIDLTRFTGKAVQVTILLGKTQKRLEVSLVQEILKHPGEVRLIEMTTAGKNALDLALAYHLGLAASQDPAGCFHIISRDKDYDPLVAHLKRAGTQAFRHEKFSAQAILGTAKPAADPEAKLVGSHSAGQQSSSRNDKSGHQRLAGAIDKVAVMAERLRKNVAHRPKTQKKLLTHVNAQFRGKLQDGEADKIVESLVDRGVISIDPKGKVTYQLSDGPPA
jgi:hypothetical protein